MNRHIHSLADLRAEISNLKEEKHLAELKLRTRIRNLSEQLKPANLIKSAFSSFLGGTGDSKNTVGGMGFQSIISFLLTDILFKKANPIVKTLTTILGTAAASEFFDKDISVYIEKIKSLYQKLKTSKQPDSNKEFDEADMYKSGE